LTQINITIYSDQYNNNDCFLDKKIRQENLRV